MPQDNDAKLSVTSDLVNSILTPELKQELLNKLLHAILGAIGGLFNRKPKLPPTPVVVPVPTGNGSGADSDDIIPNPPSTSSRQVTRARLNIYKIQLQKDRFPDAPNGGLLDNPRQYENGGNIPYGSKVWLNVTAYDSQDKEFLPPAVRDAKLSFTPTITLGDAYIKGNGPDPSNLSKPAPGYTQVSTENVGQGITAWESTLGFVQQFKVFQEGAYTCSSEVAGVKSNTFKLGVS